MSSFTVEPVEMTADISGFVVAALAGAADTGDVEGDAPCAEANVKNPKIAAAMARRADGFHFFAYT
jgi:hypothetical protein